MRHQQRVEPPALSFLVWKNELIFHSAGSAALFMNNGHNSRTFCHASGMSLLIATYDKPPQDLESLICLGTNLIKQLPKLILYEMHSAAPLEPSAEYWGMLSHTRPRMKWKYVPVTTGVRCIESRLCSRPCKFWDGYCRLSGNDTFIWLIKEH